MRPFLGSLFVLIALLSCKQGWMISNSANQDVYGQSLDSNLWIQVNPYRDSLQSKMSRVIAFSDTIWVSQRPESNLMNWCADACYWQALQSIQNRNDSWSPQACLLNFGGLRASLPQGDIVVRNIYELMPFENILCVVKITGNRMSEMLEYTLERGGDPMANMSIRQKGSSHELWVQGQQLDTNQHYWIVTSDYLANSGDKMDFFTDPIERVDLPISIRSAMINYAMHQKILRTKAVKRWQHVNP